ncbi:Protein of unknown function (DUF1620) [Nesidiocoris tenuis]|uniref:ER membrane protein complex subunit 1 n=1 Tax=Nesidiocoris tenuis TaxID=355587 RepID=A0ABN7ASN8_9HEMI|nr:Protein of unknown function (DUF1620) [Nesidiocoris tenuis]
MEFKSSAIFGLILVLASFSNALYEDQVGKFDWKLSFIGEITHSALDEKSSRIFVASKNNVIAALNAKDGKIAWRHVLESGVDGVVQSLNVGAEVVTVSGGGPFIVRSWNKSSGLLVNEWSTPLDLPIDGLWALNEQKVYYLRLNGNSVEVSNYHANSGSPAGPTKKISAPAQVSTTPSLCTMFDSSLACVSDKTLALITIGDNVPVAKSWDLQESSGNVVKLSNVGNGLLVNRVSGPSQVIYFDSTGKLVQVNVNDASKVALIKNGGAAYLVTIASSNDGHLTAEYQVMETKKTSKQIISHKFPLAVPKLISASCFAAGDEIPNCSTLVTHEDEALSLINKGKLLWLREEALANVASVEMVDLPVSDEEATLEKELANKGVDSSLTSGVIGMLSRRLSSQIIQLHHLVSAILGLIDSSSTASLSGSPVKDAFGLRKLILVSTKVSKIFAMDNEDGRIIWQKYLGQDVVPFRSIDDVVTPIYILRSARHIPYSTMATILFKERTTDNLVLYVFDPVTSSTAGGGLIRMDNKMLQCLILPEPNEQYISGLMLLMAGGQVQFYPPSTEKVAVKLADKLYMYTADPTTGHFNGYRFMVDPEKSSLKSERVWNLALPEKLVALAGKRREEHVHSQGRVLGDRSVLYKYVNPNLIAAATVSPDSASKSVLDIFLIDTVNGGIVYSNTHKRAFEPVHIVHSENWIVYSFFSEKSRRTELVALDLYEGIVQRNTTEFSSLYAPVDPMVKRQAYIFPHNIVTMKETITEKGITSKHVLVGLSTGGVMEMPWVLLDPRRSVMPTPEMREEGIVPYIPELGLPHESIITYNHTLESIRGVHTSASGLESTCLVFVYGLDLFYTRVTPSKTFDVLKDDFEYWLITAVLSALVTGAYVTKRLASRKALMLAWK